MREREREKLEGGEREGRRTLVRMKEMKARGRRGSAEQRTEEKG